MAAAAIAAQAKALGTPLGAPPAVVEHDSPSAALGDLLAHHQLAPTPQQDRSFVGLDALPLPLRQSLTRVIDAFVASEEAAAVAFAKTDSDERARQMDRLADLSVDRRTGAGAGPGDALRQAGIDLSPVLAARLVLLDAAAALEQAVGEAGVGGAETASAGSAQTTSTSCGEPSTSVAGVVAIDAANGGKGEANCYTQDFLLVVDLGGRDTYNNNAGGSLNRNIPQVYNGYGSALVDLHSQDDSYVSGRAAANGGGLLGSGFLYDDGGNDTYLGGYAGANGGGGSGGGYAGTGFLYDAWGDDTYTAGGEGSNGGGNTGVGMLLDGAGNDKYQATPGNHGTNGGGGGGSGSLIDLHDGKDSYTTGGKAPYRPYLAYDAGNGAGAIGIGMLLDAAGDGDTYTTIDNTSNAVSTEVDKSIVPKGQYGAQNDQCRTEGEVDVDEVDAHVDPDAYLVDVCAAVTGTVVSVSIDDLTSPEGNSGSSTATFTVSLSKPWPLPVEVDYASSDVTASAGSDYTPVSGTLAFAPEETSTTVSVTVAGDTVVEDNEAFTVVLTQVRGATIAKGRGQGTILNDEAPALAVNDMSVSEGHSGTTSLNVTVTLSVPTTKVVSLNYATTDATAVAPGDYSATSGTLSFAPGAKTATLSVMVNGDTAIEDNEWFFVNASGVTNATVTKAQGKATIFDDD